MGTKYLEQPDTPGADFVKRLFAVIDGRDWDGLSDFFADGCTYHRPGYDAIVGLDGIERFYREERIIENGVHEIEHVAASDTLVACWGRFRGASKDGRQLDEQFSDLYILHGKKIKTRRTYFFRAAI